MKSQDGIAGDTGQDPSFVQSAFAKIAPRYVIANHVLSLGIDILWRKFTASKVRELSPASLLDLATGSGDLSLEILRVHPHVEILSADFSEPMLQEARLAGLSNLMVADAMNLPLQDESFEAITVAFGLRNMANWSKALQEMARVLQKDGHLLILDFSLPTQPLLRKMHLWYLRQIMPSIAGWVTGEKLAYQYLCSSIEKFPAGEAMVQVLKQNGFQSVEFYPLSLGIATLYIAKK